MMDPKKWGIICGLGLVLILGGCGGAAQLLEKELRKYGYITYTTPLEQAGPGTLVGGSPRTLSIVAHPESCFPSNIDGLGTELRRSDVTQLPHSEMSLQIDASAEADLLKILGSGSPSIGAKAALARLDKLRVELKGIHVEYLDAIKLADFYRQHMSDTCKDYLDRVGFVIQAIRVDETRISFYEGHSQTFKLTIENLKQILALSPDVRWHIEHESTLVIETPKYLGYQLGRLKREDHGLALYRASQVSGERYVFKNLQVFGKSFVGDSSEKSALKASPQGFFMPLEQVPPLAVAP